MKIKIIFLLYEFSRIRSAFDIQYTSLSLSSEGIVLNIERHQRKHRTYRDIVGFPSSSIVGSSSLTPNPLLMKWINIFFLYHNLFERTNWAILIDKKCEYIHIRSPFFDALIKFENKLKNYIDGFIHTYTWLPSLVLKAANKYTLATCSTKRTHRAKCSEVSWKL